jgi:hypothetical protein
MTSRWQVEKSRAMRAMAALMGIALAGCYTGRATSLASDERLARTGLAKGDAVQLSLVSQESCRVPDPVSEGECEAASDPELAARLERCLEEQLGETRLQSGAAPRYLLTLRVRTSEGGFPTGGSSGIGWMIGRYAERTTRIDVEVLDAQRSATLGRVSAKAYGPSGRGVLFLLGFVPIPMIENAQTESAACEAMAQAVKRFLEDPEPHQWLPGSGN